MTDILATLAKPQWRGIEFEIESADHAFEQDLAEHRYYGRDGALQEATGRGAQQFTFGALFLNGVSRKPGSTQPYPDLWREFVAACEDKSAGVLLHPEIGEVNCKCRSVRTRWDPNIRDGVKVEVTFVETLTRDDELLSIFGATRPGEQAVALAQDLDEAISDVGYDGDIPDALTPSILESLKALNGLAQQIQLGIGNVSAQFDAVLGALDSLISDLGSEDNPAYQSAIDIATLLYAATLKLAEDVISGGGREVSVATVETEVSTTSAAAQFGMSLSELLKLNPTLGASTSVPAGSTVYVYVS